MPPTGVPVNVRVWPTHKAALLLVIVGTGGVQTPGTVATAVEAGLTVEGLDVQLQRVCTLCAGPVWLYVGTVAVHAPPFTEYSIVEPAGHGFCGAVIEPPVTTQPVEQALLTMVTFAGAADSTGQPGQAPGAVVTVLVGLDVDGVAAQLQRVKIVCAGPSWSYTGSVVFHTRPLSVEYCRREPAGQEPAGALITPPEGVPPTTVQVLFVTVATGAGAVRSGQSGQVPGTVVTELVGLEVAGVILQLQRVRIVWAGPVWLYVGTVVLQFAPLSVEYCKVEPAGQEPAGAEMVPPEGVPPKVVQVLFVTCATGAAAVRTGHATLRQILKFDETPLLQV